MVDYYTEACFKLDDLTPNEIAWLKDVRSVEGYAFDYVDAEQTTTVAEYLGIRFDMPPEAFEDDWYCYSGTFDIDPNGHWASFYTEGGDLDVLAMMMQGLLRLFRPKQRFVIEYAATCSRPVWDGYGGGGILISADNIEWFDGGTMAWRRGKELEEYDRYIEG